MRESRETHWSDWSFGKTAFWWRKTRNTWNESLKPKPLKGISKKLFFQTNSDKNVRQSGWLKHGLPFSRLSPSSWNPARICSIPTIRSSSVSAVWSSSVSTTNIGDGVSGSKSNEQCPICDDSNDCQLWGKLCWVFCQFASKAKKRKDLHGHIHDFWLFNGWVVCNLWFFHDKLSDGTLRKSEW